MQLKAAIIGAGLMGKWHAHSIKRIGAQVSTVIDTNAEAGLKLASEYGAQYSAEPGVILDTGNCDVVHICTSPASHFSLATLALEAGKNALVEKPLTVTESEAIQLSRKSAETGKLLCPVYQFPFQRGLKSLHTRLEQRATPPLAIEFTIASAGGAKLQRSDLNLLAVEILPHPLSVLHRLWPLGQEAEADWTVSWPGSGELIAQGVHRGIPILIKISLHARPTCCNMIVRHPQGTIEQDFFHGHAVFDSPRTSRLSKLAAPFTHSGKVMAAASANLVLRTLNRQWAYPGLDDLVRQFYAAVGNGSTEAPISPSDYIAIARTCERFSGQLPGA